MPRASRIAHRTWRYAGWRTVLRAVAVLRYANASSHPVFTLPASFEKPPDQQRIVAMLAAELHVPVDEVAALYERERANMAVGAHTTKFLHIFATRSVREILRARALGKPSPPQLGGLSPPAA